MVCDVINCDSSCCCQTDHKVKRQQKHLIFTLDTFEINARVNCAIWFEYLSCHLMIYKGHTCTNKNSLFLRFHTVVIFSLSIKFFFDTYFFFYLNTI